MTKLRLTFSTQKSPLVSFHPILDESGTKDLGVRSVIIDEKGNTEGVGGKRREMEVCD